MSLDLERRAEEIHEPEFAAYDPLVRFEAFLSAQRLFGWVRLDADRLTDLLNAHDLVRLANVCVEEHGDGRAVSAEETVIPRSEIVAVIASGPKGDPRRQLETRTHSVVIDSGVYRFGGLVHVPVGVALEQRLSDSGPMVPLADAWLQYRVGGHWRRDTGKTIIVNCGRATRVKPAGEPAAIDGAPTGLAGCD